LPLTTLVEFAEAVAGTDDTVATTEGVADGAAEVTRALSCAPATAADRPTATITRATSTPAMSALRSILDGDICLRL
jgi:hypothetical protein